jgi:glycosyltransferase involved in cell wall biosynthesis
MSHKPLVSVIIPTYNTARFVVQAVQSALAQTYSPIEVIVVDDGSTDDTRKQLEAFHGRVRYVYQSNGGVGKARNRAIREARGELLAFLDADDEWCPEKIAIQVAALETNARAALVHTDVTYQDVNSGRRFQKYSSREKYQGHCYEALFFANHVNVSTVLVRREQLERAGLFNEVHDIGGCEDLDMWLRLARENEFVYEPRPLAIYRLHSANMSLNSLKMNESLLQVLKFALAADPGLWRALGKKRVCRHMFELSFHLGYANVERGDLRRGRRYFRSALGYAPGHLKTWAFWASTFLPLGIRSTLRRLKGRSPSDDARKPESSPAHPKETANAN